jgi:hypothetical protein
VGATSTPNDAYRFAKGEEVISSNGIPARLRRPLDWLVVTDHAENLGLPAALFEQEPALTDTEWCTPDCRGRGTQNRSDIKHRRSERLVHISAILTF